MPKSIWALMITLVATPIVGWSEPAVYTVAGHIEAVFPAPPTYGGQSGVGEETFAAYQAGDAVDAVAYTLVYQIGSVSIPQGRLEAELQYVVQEQSQAVRGRITHFDFGMIGDHLGAYFTIKFRYQGASARKIALIVYNDGRLYQWSVQDFPGHSRGDALELFNSYSRFFRVTN